MELAIAIAVLTIALGAVAATVVTTRSLSQTNRETTLAADAIQSTLEALKGEPFAQVFAAFNAEANDDPLGAGTAPGHLFAVPGLNVRPGDPDGFAGEIFFPGDGSALREDAVDALLGMPRDLDGDLAVDADDHSGDYTLLPVRVRVEWTGETGERELEMTTFLVEL